MTNENKVDEQGSARFDLGALDPFAGEERLQHFVERLRPHIADELVRRRREFGLEGILLRWTRGIIAASVSVAVAASIALIFAKADPATQAEAAHHTLTESVGVPSEWAVWIESDTPPSTTALLGLEGEMQ
ncbi:MAG: hypothetical protein R3E97_11235 [Candidatus Eisenbacteria bacterium]